MTGSTKSKGGRPKNQQRAQLEQDLGLSARQVQRLIKEIGIEGITDMGALRAREKQVVIALRTMQTDRAKHELAKSKREVIPLQEAYDHGVRIANVINAAIATALSNWPCMLAGKDEMGVYGFLQEAFEEMIESIRAAGDGIK
jgi:histone H3/H4